MRFYIYYNYAISNHLPPKDRIVQIADSGTLSSAYKINISNFVSIAPHPKVAMLAGLSIFG